MDSVNFESIKQTILPYFIQFYGEENSETIIRRMNNIIPMFYYTDNSLNSKIYGDAYSKKVELTVKFLKNLGIKIPEEVEEKTIHNDTYAYLSDSKEISDFLSACFGINQYRDGSDIIKGILNKSIESYKISDYVASLNLLGVSVFKENYEEWLESEGAKPVFARLRTIQEQIDKIDAEYREFETQYTDLRKKSEDNLSQKFSINKQWFLEFLDSIEMYMNESDKKIFEEFKNSPRKDFSSIQNKLSILKIVGNNLTDEFCLDGFSSDSDEELKDSNTLDYQKNNILNKRIEYFKLMGLYQDSMDRDSFLNSDVARENWPSLEMVKDILSKKQLYKIAAEDEFIDKTSSRNRDNEMLKSLNLLDKVEYDTKTYKENGACISTSVREVDGELEATPVLFFSEDTMLRGYKDVSLIHEINHAIELSFLGMGDNKEFVYKSGFDITHSDKDDDPDFKREFELISEAFNQMCAVEITEAMHQDGVYLFDNPRIAKSRGVVTYERSFLFITPLWKQFNAVIKQARLYDMQSLYDCIGRDNFNRLNRIVNEYSAIPYYQMMSDIINKRETSLTKKREKLIAESLEVFNDMMMFSQKKNEL